MRVAATFCSGRRIAKVIDTQDVKGNLVARFDKSQGGTGVRYLERINYFAEINVHAKCQEELGLLPDLSG